MAWCWPFNKPLSEPMMVRLLTHICLTQAQWVNTLRDLRPRPWLAFCRRHSQMYFRVKNLVFWFKFELWIQLTVFPCWHQKGAKLLPELILTQFPEAWANKYSLTHWGRVTHICVGKPTIIGSDNGLSPERCQAIIWTNGGILSIGPFGTNFREILIEIQTFSLKKKHLKMSSAKCCSFRLSLNVLMMDVKRCHVSWSSLAELRVICFTWYRALTGTSADSTPWSP